MPLNITPISIKPLPTVRFPLGTHTDDNTPAIWIPNTDFPHLMVQGPEAVAFRRIRTAAKEHGYQIIEANWDLFSLKKALTWDVDPRNQAIVMYVAPRNRSVTQLSLMCKEILPNKPNVHFVVAFDLTIMDNDYIPARSNILQMDTRTTGLFCGRPIILD